MARIQPSPFDIGAGGAPLGQLKTTSRNVTALGALPVRVAMRKNVGLLNLSKTNIVVVTLAMLAVHWFDNVHFNLFSLLLGGGVVYGNHLAMLYFAFVWLVLAVFERFKRLDEEKRGVEPHNFWQGDSRFDLAEFLPVKPKIIAIVVEPGLAFLAGGALRRMGFSALGLVIIASALCFGVSEWRLSRQLIDRRRVRRDLDKEAQWEADLANQSVGRFEDAQSPDPLRTGIDGLENEIANRRQGGAESAQGGAL